MGLSAIVTGGTGDIGQAILTALKERGYRLGVLDLDAPRVAGIAAAHDGVPLPCDVTDAEAVAGAVAAFGAPDLLVNNAGIGRFGPLMDMDLEDFRAVMRVNFEGAFIVSRACAAGMAKRGSGVIVNITSLNALTAGPGAGAYPAAKAGLAKLSEQMAQEWGPLGIRVNCVAPGFIDAGISTPFYRDPEVRALRAGAVPSRRLGTAGDVAEAVAFLASDAAGYINGVQLAVDGGTAVSLLSQLPRSKKG